MKTCAQKRSQDKTESRGRARQIISLLLSTRGLVYHNFEHPSKTDYNDGMTIIDHRILIPTSPGAVWGVLSNIQDNTKWQADCRAVSFLTSARTGPGVRWRYSSPGGQEFVVETTAWYDGLGYEYTYVDGAPFRTSKVTIRLQEIPEGTIVQWTLEYETGGFLGGLRDALAVKRHYSTTITNNLKGLWSHIKETGRARQEHEAKSLMRDAPDYEARSQYVPRHPSRLNEAPSSSTDIPSIPEPVTISPAIPEPPLSKEDTRPNPALKTESSAPKPSAPAQDVLVPDRPVEPSLTRFQRPTTPDLPAESETLKEPPASEPEPSETPPPESAPMTSPEAVISSSPKDQTAVTEIPAMTDVPQEPEISQASPAEQPDIFKPKIDTSKLDTREVSIWDVFGIEPPSKTQQMKAVTDQQAVETPLVPSATPVPEVKADTPPAEPTAHVPSGIDTPKVTAARPAPPAMTTDSATPAIFFVPGFRARQRRKHTGLRLRM